MKMTSTERMKTLYDAKLLLRKWQKKEAITQLSVDEINALIELCLAAVEIGIQNEVYISGIKCVK